ncbi:Subtilase family protein [Hibiscus syriacus]|uniref:Subtilase family protein n=1 Tax=Hibiscus syriacus TaxID=106335 RepID=A0A6A3AC22_HIBSY|nr:Subtilase family protein [Hibiscus syriacus]
MAVDQQTTTTKPPRQTHVITASRCQARRRVLFLRLRRHNKLPTVRLGGKKPRRGLLIVKVLKKMRLRWLKLQYSCMWRKMKKYYNDLVKDLVEAGSAVEALHQRMFMESTFAVPVMGVSFASYPSATGSDRPRPYFF